MELDDRIATASEKAPTEDKSIILLREALSDVKKEYEEVLIHEEKKVREAGGLHVIGTERHESRRLIINLEVEQEDKVTLEVQDSFYL